MNPLNDEQLQAISLRGASILVSAPAGSGKTKILVERILSLIKTEGYFIDELLVLTFTEAAATEMKQRLLLALDQEILHSDGWIKAHLKENKARLDQAYVMNFHGFCGEILRKYGYLIGVDPGYEILADSEAIQQQILDDLLEQWTNQEEIASFIQLYFPEYRYDGFKAWLLSIYRFSHTMDDFHAFYQEVEDLYQEMIDQEDITTWRYFPVILSRLKKAAQEGLQYVEKTAQFAQDEGLETFMYRPEKQGKVGQKQPIPYDALKDYYHHLLEILTVCQRETFLQDCLKEPEKAYTMKYDEEIEKKTKDRFNDLKQKATKHFIETFESLIDQDVQQRTEILKTTLAHLRLLLGPQGLLEQFLERYQQYKHYHHLLDFNDLEKQAIALLEPQYGVSEVLYTKLKEIMIDEYQDTNKIQETLIQKIIAFKEPSIPCFMVGDMKQSIYRFRQADPELFKEKYDTFSQDDQHMLQSKTRRIDLKYNYRSNKVVLDSINYLFNSLMDEQVGGLAYYQDPSAWLNYDYARKEKISGDLSFIRQSVHERLKHDRRFETEVLLVNKESEDARELQNEEYEAHMVARRILELMKETLDDRDFKPRGIHFKDMAILMRSTTSFLTFKKVFDQYHIPSQIVLSQGFKSTIEIENMLYFLKALDDPYDDLALLSILRAPYAFTSFRENQLTSIRLKDKSSSLYTLLQNEEDEKIKQFLEIFEALRGMSQTRSFYDLVSAIYEKTQYVQFVSGLLNGSQRKANLILWHKMVQERDSKDLTLRSLIDTFERMQDSPTATIPSSDDDSVVFMTIHKSKGLEFPIVFVSGLQHQFNMSDRQAKMMMDKHLGMSLKVRKTFSIQEGALTYGPLIGEYKTGYHELIASQQEQLTLDEEMRILYVALTRASQKLILTGVMSPKHLVDWLEEAYDQQIPAIRKDQDEVIYTALARHQFNDLDWLGIALVRHPDIQHCLKKLSLQEELQQKINEQCLRVSLSWPQIDAIACSQFYLAFYDKASLVVEKMKPQSCLLDQENHKLQQDRARARKISTQERVVSVTDLQKEVNEHYLMDHTTSKTILSPTERGTLVHAFLEFLPLKEHLSIEAEIERFTTHDLEREALLEEKADLEAFLQSDAFQEMLKAPIVLKEECFNVLDEEKKQMVHGVFDVVCVYEDHLTIIDYKTDRLSTASTQAQLENLHRVQMNYYQHVLEKLYPDQKVEAWVYYLYLHQYVIVS